MVDQIVQSIVDWISVAPILGVYLIFFGIAYLENVLPPVPGDIIVAFGGYLAAEGVVSLPLLWVVTVCASVVGFMNMYWLGHKWGVSIESNRDSHFILRFIDYKYFAKGKSWMEKWGQWIVFGNRFLAGTRSVISLTAGISHLNIGLTALNSLISSVLWNALLLGMGWYVRDNWKIIGKYLSSYGELVVFFLIIALLLRFGYKFMTSREKDLKK